jgi:hypothetical protein
VSSGDHYVNKMAKYKLSLLHSYLPPEISLDYLEGRFVISTPSLSEILGKNDEKERNERNERNESVSYSATNGTVYDSEKENKYDSNNQSSKSQSIQIPKHPKYHAENLHGNSFNISSIPIGRNITTEIPVGIQGLRYHQVKNGILTVFPDFCSFLVAYSDSRHQTVEVMVTNTYALYELFQYYPDIENQNNGNNNSVIYNSNNSKNSKNDNSEINKYINSNKNNNNTTQSNGIMSKILISPLTPHSHLSASINCTHASHTSMTKVFTADNREFFLVKDCMRFGFPDAGTFLAMGFSFKNAVGLRKKLLMMIPYSGMLERVEEV